MMRTGRGHKWIGFAAAAGVALAIAQAARWALLRSLPLGSDEWSLLGGVLLLRPEAQPGLALGLLGSPEAAWTEPLLWGGVALAALGLAQLLWRAPGGDTLSGTAVGLVLGGAASNALDRIQLGAVIEYVRIDLLVLRLPQFNLADVALAAGIVLLLLDLVVTQAGASADAAPE